MFKKIAMILILLMMLTGCALQREDVLLRQNNEFIQEEQPSLEEENEDIFIPEKQIIPYVLGTPQEQLGLEPPVIGGEPSDSGISVGYFTNEEDYFNLAFPYRDYDEDYFNQKDLLVVEAFTHIFGVNFEMQELTFENNILTIHILEKAPSVYFCVYLPRFIYFYLEFDKVEEVNEVLFVHQVRYDYESYYLPVDQEKILQRLEDSDYLDVTVSLMFSFQQVSSIEQEAYISQKIAQWVEPIFLDDLDLVNVTNYGFSIYIHLTQLEMDELNQLMLCLADEELEFLTVGFRNF